jgi:hypothetical protein
VCTPMAGTILRIALVPFICAVPTMEEFWHSVADASQKMTVPVVMGALPPNTEAVNVTGAGDATVGDESTSVVVVGTAAACAAYGRAAASRAEKSSL